jgi:hypothetical protein
VIEFITLQIKTYWMLFLILSIVTIIASLASVSILLISLPSDYFSRKKRGSRIRNPILRLLLRLLKNVCGIVFLIGGFIMLFTPGQGILSLLVGVILCDFPGKRRVERKIIERPLVLSTINRIRARYNRPLIVLDD